MRKLLRLFFKYYSFLLFLILEAICFIAIFQHNNYHNAIFINSSNIVSGTLQESWSEITYYFSLKKENEKLHRENKKLRRIIERREAPEPAYSNKIISAKVINMSVFNKRNYLTINKGKKHGLQKQMAVISPEGVIGFIENSSTHYSSVIPVINTGFHLSAAIKRNNYFGTLSWDGKDYRYVQLEDIPASVEVNRGDTIVTSGYSSTFPHGELIGYVVECKKNPGSPFRDIKVKLATDFKQIRNVYVIKNPLRKEQLQTEKTND